MRRSLFALALMASACTKSYVMYRGAPYGYRPVRLWLQRDDDLPVERTLRACETWRVEGVSCSIVQDPKLATIRIRIDTAPCKMRSDGTYALARSSNDGTIWLHAECLRLRGAQPIDPETYRATLAHEIGHELGIWCHVPAERGGALMNPLIHSDLHGITVLDHEAYLQRDHLRSRGRGADPEQLCVEKPPH